MSSYLRRSLPCCGCQLALLGLLIYAPGCTPSTNNDLPREWSATGTEEPSLASFDAIMKQYMQDRSISAGALAVTRNGRCVLARGYTWAPAGTALTMPTSLFRIASLSKPLTAVGVLQLVEAGSLQLDQKIGEILDTSHWVDRRIAQVTVRHLLQHRGGWDRDVSFDPMFRDQIITAALGRALPTTPQMVIDYMATQPLDFAPGTAYAYSNFGYCLLGRIIEKVSGQPYEEYIRQHVLAPIGAESPRVTHSLRGQQWPGEVEYVDDLGRRVPSVMGAGSPALVPIQYGGWNITTMDSHGGWVASAVDLARFAAAFDNPPTCPLLSESSIETMWSRPAGASEADAVYYAAGWQVRILNTAGLRNVWHTGSLDGTFTIMVRRCDGLNWVALFNQRSNASDHPASDEIDGMLHTAADAVTSWPQEQN